MPPVAKPMSLHVAPPPLPAEMIVHEDRLEVNAELTPGLYRCDLATEDGGFDIDTLYIRCLFRSFQEGNTPDDPGAPLTGPWDYINNDFVVPRARVLLDGVFLDHLWFDLPGTESLARRRVEGSFGFWIAAAGLHRLEIVLDMAEGRLAPARFGPAVLRCDERLPTHRVQLRPELCGEHPRLLFGAADLPRLRALKDGSHRATFDSLRRCVEREEARLGSAPRHSNNEPLGLLTKLSRVYAFIGRLEDNRQWLDRALELALEACEVQHWGYAVADGHMGRDNDMRAGESVFELACAYDWLHGLVDADGLATVRAKLCRHARMLYEFAVFQRNYWPTGYMQNHCTGSLCGLATAGLVFLGEEEEAAAWADLARRSFEGTLDLMSQDGSGIGLEISFGMRFFLQYAEVLLAATGEDLYSHPGLAALPDYYTYASAGTFANRAILAYRTGNKHHQAQVGPRLVESGSGMIECFIACRPEAMAPPASMPPCRHFEDGGVAALQSGWDGADRTRLIFRCGPPMAHSVVAKATRYNFAHAMPDAGSFQLHHRGQLLLANAGASYCKRTNQHNTVTIDGEGQWGDGYVWMPKIEPDQAGRIVEFRDTATHTVVIADATQAYPPSLGLGCFRRSIGYFKPDVFVVYDRLESGTAKAYQWWWHTKGEIEAVEPGLYRITIDDASYCIADISGTDPEPEIADSEIVATYRFDGNYARHLRFELTTPGPATDALFCLAPTPEIARQVQVEREAGGLRVGLAGRGAVRLDTTP